MRIRRLDLLAFGPFDGVGLDLSPAENAVDVVFGPNEAGKSTTLRAILGLLFGIADTRDAHRYEPKMLRVGGRLATSRGEQLEFVRRRGRKGTIRDPGGEPLGEDCLDPFVGGFTRQTFERMFGLDHATLRTSAEELLAGGGAVGESLFSAGMGGRGLHELRTRLETEAAALFVPRARERLVNKALAEVEAAREVVRSAVTSPAKYLEQVRAHEESMRARDALRRRSFDLVAEQGRLRRVETVLPHLRLRAELVAQISGLGDVVELPAGASELRLHAVRDIEEAERELGRAATRQADLEQEVREIVVSERLLAVDEAALGRAQGGLSRFLSAEADRPKLEAKAVAIEASVKRSLERLGVARVNADLSVPLSRAARIRGLSAKKERLDGRMAELARALGEARARRDHLKDRIASRASPADRGAIVSALARAAELSAPGPETLDRFAERRARLESDRARLEREGEKKAERRRTAERLLDELRQQGAVPSEAELAEVRRARDTLFRELWEESERKRFAALRFAEYEALAAEADRVSDRLRREASRVADQAKLEAECRAASVELDDNNRLQRELSAQLEEVDLAWANEWHEVGLVPRPPAEMRSSVRDLESLVEVLDTIRRAEAELEDAERALESWQLGWTEAIDGLGLGPSATTDEALFVLDAMGQLLQQVVESSGLRQRTLGIERDSAAFAREVAALSEWVLPGAPALGPRETAERVLDAVQGARAARDRQAALLSELELARASASDQEARQKDARGRLSTLLARARARDQDELVHLEKQSDLARRLGDELRIVDAQLLEAGDGAPLDALEREARGEDLDRVRARLREIEGELAELGEQMETANAAVWGLERHLHNLEHTDAAEARAVLEDRVSVLKRHTHRYIRVRLAGLVLDREIERYREENQGPILARARELFPRLTIGRYSGLRAGVDDRGDSVLLAVRADAAEVPVSGLSDGTRDQLYLALRLASLERYVRANEPMPLVLDDALVHFDDDRAKAALDVLGEVAQSTQVLFFTHHARLVELAERTLGPDRLTLHRLPAGG